MSEMESAYFLNDPYFVDLQSGCASELEKAKKSETEPGGYNNFCARDIPADPAPSGAILLSAAEYFDYTPPATIADGFADRIYAQTYVKRTIKTALLQNVFKSYNETLQRYSVMKSQIVTIKQRSEDVKKELAAVTDKPSQSVIVDRGTKLPAKGTLRAKPILHPSPSAGVTVAGSVELSKYAHAVCCTVKLLMEESQRVSESATEQARNLCDIRLEIQGSLLDSVDPVVKILARSRLDEIDKHIKNDEAKDACKFTLGDCLAD